MNASKLFFSAGLGLIFGLSTSLVAAQGLNPSSQTKVNGAMAKAWSKSDESHKEEALEKRVVKIGSKRDGTCGNVNVGTVQPGQKAPKQIVVTTKDVINICK